MIRQVEDLRLFAPIQHDASTSAQLAIRPFLRRTYLSYNFVRGPLRDVQDGRSGRLALSLAVNRRQLVAEVCGGGLECVAATGGIITNGLDGFLGIDGDPNGRFDPQGARQLCRSWDPDGSRLRGLTLTTWAPFRDVAEAYICDVDQGDVARGVGALARALALVDLVEVDARPVVRGVAASQ